MAKLVALDAGHYYTTAGKRCPDGSMREWEFNYAAMLYLKTELEYNNFKTIVVSDSDKDTPLSTRASRANANNADICVSIHANAAGNTWTTANGIETYAYSKTSKGNKLASLVQEELIKETGLRDRGVKYNSLYMTRVPKMASILCECGFMDNKKEAELLKSDVYRRKCAKAICRGICRYFRVTYKDKDKVKKEEVNNSETFKVKIIVDELNVRKGNSTKYEVVTVVKKNEVYTIVETKDGWGLLKSYAKDKNGWININERYIKKI